MLACGALLSAISVPGQSAILDRDDREYVSVAQDSPYAPIGIVVEHELTRIRPFRATTGFLVDDCHVLTTQTVMDYRKNPVGRRLKFQTGIGTSYRQTTKGTVIAVGGAEKFRTREEEFEHGGRDWLLLRLDRCVGANLGHVEIKSGPFIPFDFRNLRSAGFPRPRGKKNGITIDPSCHVYGSNGTLWLNDCAAVAGDAGDPIFRMDSGARPHIMVYAMQSRAYLAKEPLPSNKGYENEAVPMYLVAPQIEPFLSVHPSDKLPTAR